LVAPEPFFAVGEWYRDFSPTSDEEVIDLLRRAASGNETAEGTTSLRFDEELQIRTDDLSLPGWLAVPPQPRGIVVFAHGSGSSRHSPRNRFVAKVLHQAGLATLLIDLLTPEEETERTSVFDIELLASRLGVATGWVRRRSECADCDLGVFGASTGAAAALWAAARPECEVRAVVSRGGRPDLAATHLREVRAPTLLIVGERDGAVAELNRRAQAELRCENELCVIPGATHLFEEPGALESMAGKARDWFVANLQRGRA
jgi:putative phosphoribosyl transferase